MQLDHERLDVYQGAIRFLAAAYRIPYDPPRGHSALADQLRRAAISVPLNIAEGAGKIAPREKARFYTHAFGSAMECGAVLDCLVALDLVDAEDAEPMKRELVRVVAMLSRLCQRPA